ncbi:MAG: DMT family transporter [Lachnospiraceae bacterium]|nr:DMT family transporter [Lachnospiraceae bacterium]
MNKRREIICTLVLFVTALIWGCAFAAQSIGAGFVGPFTFLASRTWIAFFALLPVIAVRDRLQISAEYRVKKTAGQSRMLVLGGAVCGFFLFTASASQQIGISLTTTAKAGFITALYVVLVPVLSVFMHRSVNRKVWGCVLLAVIGLYLLCMGERFSLSAGDSWMLLCAFLFSLQILSVNYFVKYTDPVKLATLEFLFEGIFAGLCMLLFEPFDAEGILSALPSILYAGFMSSAVGYTLQIVAQDGLDPAVASIAMSFESVFAALAGWVVLREAMSARELIGCALMFAAIVISQL